MGDTMFERWRQPAKILHIETNPDSLVDMGDGRIMQDAHVITDEATAERIRQGYVCIRCGEGHPEAFPRFCTVCSLPMRDVQSAWFARLYTGVEDLRARPSIDAEEERMQEQNERARSARNKGSRIWVPDRGA